MSYKTAFTDYCSNFVPESCKFWFSPDLFRGDTMNLNVTSMEDEGFGSDQPAMLVRNFPIDDFHKTELTCTIRSAARCFKVDTGE